VAVLKPQINNKYSKMITYNINHINGLFFEITGDEGKNKEYDVIFSERITNSGSNFTETPSNGSKVIYETKLMPNAWAKLERKYLSDIIITVKRGDRVVTVIELMKLIKGKRVFINFESSSLGDTIAWMPYCLEFQNTYECTVVVSTFKNFLFKSEYPELEFVERGRIVPNIFAQFDLGWFYNKSKEPVNPATVPLQQTATNILKLPFREIRPRIAFQPKEKPIEGKYVAISTHSTAHLKYWGYWQEVIDYLVDEGYKVIEISAVPPDTQIQKLIDNGYNPHFTNMTPFTDLSLDSTMNAIYHAEFVMGLSSGLSWLAWGMGKKVIMVSNFTRREHEFQENCIRITDESVCFGCWNNPIFKFDKGSWTYCPENEDTPDAFICHKAIKARVVIEKIKHLISEE